MSVRRRLLAALMLPPLSALLPAPLSALLLALPLAACDPAPREGAAPAAPAVAPGTTGAVNLDNRPFQLHVPRSYDPAKKAPLVVLLHGYQSNPVQAEAYFKLTAESERRGFLYAMPGGTKDQRGHPFWNATEACCDFYASGVDDSAYLSHLIDAVKASYSVDPGRVHLVGHSNGGYMSYRMACDHADQITAIVSLAGAAVTHGEQCKPQRPVRVLQIHGTADQTVLFEGGSSAGQPYPSAAATVDFWRRNNGCGDRADTSAAPLDLDSSLPGNETAVTVYSAGCRDATGVELWSIKDGGHIPALGAGFAPAIIDFLYRA